MGEELYQKLYGLKLYTKSFGEFQQKYGTPEGQLELYNKLSNGSPPLYTNSFQEFKAKYWTDAQQVPEAVTQNVVEPEDQRELQKGLFKQLHPSLEIPVVGDMMFEAARSFGAGVTEQLPQMGGNIALGMTQAQRQDLPLKLNHLLLKEVGEAGLALPQDVGSTWEKNRDNVTQANEILVSYLRANNRGERADKIVADVLGEGEDLQQRARDLNEFVERKEQAYIAMTPGAIRDLREIQSASDMIRYIGGGLGQTASTMLPAAATFGTASFFMEGAEAYDNQIAAIAESTGLSRAEVIDKKLDDPAAMASLQVLIAGGLDAISAGKVLHLFRLGAGKNPTRLGEAIRSGVFEGLTEATQGNLTRWAGHQYAGRDFNPFDSENMWQTANEAALGFIGGGPISFITGPENSHEYKQLDKLTRAVQPQLTDIEAEYALQDAKIAQWAADNINKISELGLKEEEDRKKREAEEKRIQAEALELANKAMEETNKRIAAEEELRKAQHEIARKEERQAALADLEGRPVVSPDPLTQLSEVEQESDLTKLQKTYAIPEPSTEAVLQPQQGETTVTGSERGRVEPVVKGPETTTKKIGRPKKVVPEQQEPEVTSVVRLSKGAMSGVTKYHDRGGLLHAFTENEDDVGIFTTEGEPSSPVASERTDLIESFEQLPESTQRPERFNDKSFGDTQTKINFKRSAKLLRIQDSKEELQTTTMVAAIKEKGELTPAQTAELDALMADKTITDLRKSQIIAAVLRKLGYDGVIYKNITEERGVEHKRPKDVHNEDTFGEYKPTKEELLEEKTQDKLDSIKKLPAKKQPAKLNALRDKVIDRLGEASKTVKAIDKALRAAETSVEEEKERSAKKKVVSEIEPGMAKEKPKKAPVESTLVTFRGERMLIKKARDIIGIDVAEAVKEGRESSVLRLYDEYKKLVDERNTSLKEGGKPSELPTLAKFKEMFTRPDSMFMARAATRIRNKQYAAAEQRRKKQKEQQEADAQKKRLVATQEEATEQKEEDIERDADKARQELNQLFGEDRDADSETFAANPAVHDRGVADETRLLSAMVSIFESMGVTDLGKDALRGFKKTIESILTLVRGTPHAEQIVRMLDQVRKKTNTSVEFYVLPNVGGRLENSSGFYHMVPKTNKVVVVLFTNPDGSLVPTYTSKTVAHEVAHTYYFAMMKLIHNGAMGQSRRRSMLNVMNDLYNGAVHDLGQYIRALFSDATTDLTARARLAKYLTLLAEQHGVSYEFNLKVLTLAELARSADDSWSAPTRVELQGILDKLTAEIYGLTNPVEFFAEAFSDSNFATLLAVTPTRKYNKVRPSSPLFIENSILWSIYRGITNTIKKLVSSFTGDQPSVYQRVVDSLIPYESLLLENENVSFSQDLPRGTGHFYENKSEKVGGQGVSGGKKPRLNRTFINKVAVALEIRDKIMTREDIEKYVAGINKRIPDERKHFAAPYIDAIFKKIQTLRAKRSDYIKVIKDKVALAEEVGQLENHPTLASVINDVSRLNYSTIPINELARIHAGVVDITVVGTVPNPIFDKILRKHTALGRAREIAEHSPAYKKTFGIMPRRIVPSGWRSRAGKISSIFGSGSLTLGVRSLVNPATWMTIIARYNPAAANTLFKNLFLGSTTAKARTQHLGFKFIEALDKALTNAKLSHKAVTKISIFGDIFSTLAAPGTPEWQTEILAQAKNAVTKTMNALIAKGYDPETGTFDDTKETYTGPTLSHNLVAEYENAQEFVEILTNNLGSINKLDDAKGLLLSEQESQIYDLMHEFFGKYQMDMSYNARVVWGDKAYKQRYNYFPTVALGHVLDGTNATEVIDPKADNLFSAAGNQSAIHRNSISANKTGFIKARTMTNEYYYDYLPLSIVRRWTTSALFDMFAAREAHTVNYLLNHTNLRSRKLNVLAPQVLEGVTEMLRSSYGAYQTTDPSANLWKWYQGARNLLHTAYIATGGQFIGQLTSGVMQAAFVTSGVTRNATAYKEALKTMVGINNGQFRAVTIKNFKEFLKRHGGGIQGRDLFFEQMMDFDYVTTQTYAGLTKFKKAINKMDDATKWALKTGDRNSAAFVWWTAFYANGGTIHKPTREAVAAAERATGVYQGMSDTAFAPDIFKYKTGWHQVAMDALMLFKMFSLNTMINNWFGIRYSLRSGSPEARQVIMGNALSQAAYTAIYTALIGSLYKAIANLGDDDDENDRLLTQAEREDEAAYGFAKTYSEADKFAFGAAFDFILGGLPAFSTMLAKWAINESYFKPKFKEDDPYGIVEFDPAVHTPFYAPQDKELFSKMAEEALGLPGDVGKTLVDALLAQKAYAEVEEIERLLYEAGGIYASEAAGIKDEERKIANMRLMGLILSGSPFVPLRGDVKRYLNQRANEEKAELKRYKAGELQEP